MKKLLISTSALVAIAGVANAQVTLTGSAEAGLTKGAHADDKVKFHTDMDVNFRGVGTTDGGLQFGATVDLDEAQNLGRNQNGNPSVFITSNSFGTLTLGDTDGAFDRVLDEVGMLTTIADDHTSHAGYNGNSGLDGYGKGYVQTGSTTTTTISNTDPATPATLVMTTTPDYGITAGSDQILRYDRQFGIFELSVSYEHPNGKNAGGATKETPAVWGVGGSLDFGGGDNASYTVALGIQGSGENTIFGLSGVARFSGVDVRLNYSQLPTHDRAENKLHAKDGTHIGFGVGYTINDFAIAFNFGQYKDGAGDKSGWGLVVNYSLSGGATIQAGLAQSDQGKGSLPNEEIRYSVGLSLNF